MWLPDVDAPLPQWGDGFEIETLINLRVAASGLSVAEVCSYEKARMYGLSNLNAVGDGMRVLRTIQKEYARLRACGELPRGDGNIVSTLDADVIIPEILSGLPEVGESQRSFEPHVINGAKVQAFVDKPADDRGA
jgi:hypothetical protein